MRFGIRPALGRSRNAAPAALVVAAAYALSGLLWLVLSDWILESFASDRLAAAQAIRGIGFVAVTSVALYLVLRSLLGALRGGSEARTELAAEVAARAEEQQRLSHRLFEAEEETRRAVAKDLHDGPLQALTISFMQLDAALRAAEEEDLPLDAERVSGVMSTLKEASNEIRAVVRSLHPPLLMELGLSAAVERHCNEVAALTRREVCYEGERDLPTLPPPTSIALFRIAQEAVANAVKYTDGNPIVVTMSASPSEVRIDITDSGPGFDADISYGGLGLVSMRERAESVGGRMTVTSTADGTRVSVVAPLAA